MPVGFGLWAFLWHLLPILPASMGRPYAVAAAVLLVALPYIKVQKLRAQARHLEEGGAESAGGRALAELNSLRKAAERWRRLTFLRS